MVMAPIAGRLSDKVGARGLASGGLCLAALGAFFLSRIDATTAVPDVLWRLAVFGFGIGMFMAPNNNAVMSAAPQRDRGVASGLLALFRFTGQAMGFAGAGTLFVFAAGPARGLIAPEANASAPSAALQADFVHGFHAVCLAVIPIALAGAAMSFSRGRKRPHAA